MSRNKFFEVRPDIMKNPPGLIIENENEIKHPNHAFWMNSYPKSPGFDLTFGKPILRYVKKQGRLPFDFERISCCFLITNRTKLFFEKIDPHAFVFLECEAIFGDERKSGEFWLCDVIRILDVLDEKSSDVKINYENGTKIYNRLVGSNINFKENLIGDAKIFRLKFEWSVFCNQEFRETCKQEKIRNITFKDTIQKPIPPPAPAPSDEEDWRSTLEQTARRRLRARNHAQTVATPVPTFWIQEFERNEGGAVFGRRWSLESALLARMIAQSRARSIAGAAALTIAWSDDGKLTDIKILECYGQVPGGWFTKIQLAPKPKANTNTDHTPEEQKEYELNKYSEHLKKLAFLNPWLEKHSPEAAAVIASRIGLRVLPFVVDEPMQGRYSPSQRRHIIFAFRYAAIGRLATERPSPSLIAADTAFNMVSPSRGYFAGGAIFEASCAPFALLERTGGLRSADSARSRTNHAATFAVSVSEDPAPWKPIASDTAWIDAGGAPLELLNKPLWLDCDPSRKIPDPYHRRWELMRTTLENEDESWKIWTSWYQERLQGAPSQSAEIEYCRLIIVPDAAAKAADQSETGRRLWQESIDANATLFRNDARKANRIVAKFLTEMGAI